MKLIKEMSNIINKTGLSCKTLSIEWMRRHWLPLFLLYLGLVFSLYSVPKCSLSTSHPPQPIPREGKINLLVSPLTAEINCRNLVPSKCYIHSQDINITNLKEPKWLHNRALSVWLTVFGHTKLAWFSNWNFFPPSDMLTHAPPLTFPHFSHSSTIHFW